MAKQNDLLYGTLDFLVLRTLRLEALHGYGILQRLDQITNGSLRLNGGTLFPALYRLERQGYLRGGWRVTDTGRRARFYSLTALGRKKLEEEAENWNRAVLAVSRVVDAT